MADERSLSELLWDYGVYAPIGLAAAIVDELPHLSDKGKERAANRIHMAKMIGQLAVGQGKRQLGKLFGDGQGHVPPSPPAYGSAHTGSSRPAEASGAPPTAESGIPGAGAPVTGSRGTDAGRSGTAAPRSASNGKAPTTPSSSRPASDANAPAAAKPRRQATRTATPARAATAAQPAADSLAIPGYDTLAASQVVQRLSSLRPDELEAIRRYELSTRGRRTILHRVAQLAADR